MPQPCRIDACRRYSKSGGLCLYHMRDTMPTKDSTPATTTAPTISSSPPRTTSNTTSTRRPPMALSPAPTPTTPTTSHVSMGGPVPKPSDLRAASTTTGPYHQPHRRWVAISKVRYHHTGWIKCLVPQCHSEAKRHFAFCSGHENSVVCVHERTKQYLSTSHDVADGDAAPVDRVSSMSVPKSHMRRRPTPSYTEDRMHHPDHGAATSSQHTRLLHPMEL
ncbi:hypothetical protein H310_12644 [Aphanomyces invadans]|uniref:Uncharacterized protein n=1 Tax=Aphanomyces invadans TaxID=157072 RepID=A0A024TGY3_9STRA|nr:hypothetical protein H310_12644 [Aphanomyces invadans]ETV93385.1 hypothetical protein H310_12644 [Aphanomyces invadans]|eukprot:XP_008878021.1 hypothetical protein H310_12644 [Aphanomyces invadans]